MIKRVSNVHLHTDKKKDVLTFTTARSGSTLINEMIATQPGFKPIHRSLFDFRDDVARKELARYGLFGWEDFYDDANLQKVADYIDGFRKGKIRSSDPIFFRNHWRVVTQRLVCKALNAFEDRMEWFREHLGFAIIYLVRHPIPVSLSRATLPRLELMLTSRYRDHFTTAQLKLADHLLMNGTKMQKAVLDWSLQNSVCLQQMRPEWLMISYEQLVLDPDNVIRQLSNRLQLAAPDKMADQLFKPSRSTALSDAKTQKILEQGSLNAQGQEKGQENDQARKQYLIERWRKKIDRGEEERLMDIVRQFDIDAYRFDSVRPDSKYWLNV